MEDILQEELTKLNMYITPDPAPEKGFFYRSDHISFAKKGVPMLYADGGVDNYDGGIEAGSKIANEYTQYDYHQPSDEYNNNWNMEGIEQTVNTIFNISNDLANSSDWPNWYEGNEFKSIRDASRLGK